MKIQGVLLAISAWDWAGWAILESIQPFLQWLKVVVNKS